MSETNQLIRNAKRLTNSEYHALPHLGSTTLKTLDREGPAYLAAMQACPVRTESRALVFGGAVHAVMDGTFFDQYAVAPESYKTATSDKFLTLASESSKPLLTVQEAQEVTACGNALRAAIGPYIAGRQKLIEPSFLWTQETARYRVPCKCRPDMLLIDPTSGDTVYVEIKTAAQTGLHSWRSSCWQYGYWLQQAHYQAGIVANGAESVRTVFVVVRKSPPYDVQCYSFSSDDAAASESRWLALVDEYARRVEENDWRGGDLMQPVEVFLGVKDVTALEGFDNG
jgi:hypothetical protein